MDDRVPEPADALQLARALPSVCIVVAQQNSGWVIGKMGRRLSDALTSMGVQARVSDVADPGSDINHWMSFAFADGCATTLNTMLVTHADDPYKVKLISQRLQEDIQLALCMSPHACAELSAMGAPPQRLWHVLPALDRPLAPRRIRIGITTRVYADGRKRESMLVRLAQAMRLDAFEFQIFGHGWEKVAAVLVGAGARVELDAGSEDWQGDYARIVEATPHFDYYLYLGMDEGSLGTLDAASAGVKTIVTAQGFHLSLPVAIDHPFTDYEQLHSIFTELSAKHHAAMQRFDAWSWQTFAEEHLAIWQAMLRYGRAPVPRAELETSLRRRPQGCRGEVPAANAGAIAFRGVRFYARALQPRRLLGAIARTRVMQPLRRLMGR